MPRGADGTHRTGKSRPKHQFPPTQDLWGSHQTRGPRAGLGASAGVRGPLGHPARALSLCAGSTPALPAPAPGRAVLSRCRLRSSQGGQGDSFFLVTIIPSFFPPPHLPFGCWKLLLVLGLFLLAQDRGPAGPRLPCSDHGCAARGASPNSHPPPCGPAAVPAASGSAGAVPCVPKRGVPRQWGPWWGERGQCSPRLLWGGFRIPPPSPPAPASPLQGPGGERAGLAL